MTKYLSLVIAAFLALPAQAAEDAEQMPEPLVRDGVSADLNEFLWINRPVIVFADSENDPRFATQMELLAAGEDALRERDAIVLTDTDPDANSELRTKLRPRGFMLVLIGKDGGVKLRKPLPWDVRELSRTIDKMPMRQQEIEDRRGE